jgi:hypothetical protein
MEPLTVREYGRTLRVTVQSLRMFREKGELWGWTSSYLPGPGHVWSPVRHSPADSAAVEAEPAGGPFVRGSGGT